MRACVWQSSIPTTACPGIHQRHHQTKISTLSSLYSVLLLHDLHPASMQVRRGRHHCLVYSQVSSQLVKILGELLTSTNPLPYHHFHRRRCRHDHLNWSRSMYGYLLATDYACLGLASSILLPCLIRFCRLSDFSLAIIGVIFKIFRLAMMSYGRYTWLVYLSVVVGCPSALIISSSKSLISKLVGEDELGKTFSLLSCGETISNLIGSLLFTLIYGSTVHVLPGFTFLLECVLMFLLLCVLLSVTYHMTKSTSEIKLSTGRYGSVDSTALHAAAADDDGASLEHRVSGRSFTD